MAVSSAMTPEQEKKALEDEQTILKLRQENKELREGKMPFSVMIKGNILSAIMSAGAVALFLKGCTG